MNPTIPVPQAPQGSANESTPKLSNAVPPGLPDLYAKPGHPGGRLLAFGAVIAAHVVAGWALLQIDSVRTAVKEASPIFVDLIIPAPPPPPVKPPPPPPPAPKVVTRPPPPPAIITTRPSPTPAPFVAPPPPVEPPPPVAPVVVEAPPAPPAPPPPPPAPAPPAAPRMLSASEVEYQTSPSVVYPAVSARLRESGKVVVKVCFDERGVPYEAQLARSSGSARLDEAAKAALRGARLKPLGQLVCANAPIEFNLEDR